MKKEIIINESISETRIAILEDGRLAELYVERPENERMVGDIYKGKVENVIEGIKGGFVDLGMKQNGFLPFSDIGKVYSSLAGEVSIEEKEGESGHGASGSRPRQPFGKHKKGQHGHLRPRIHSGQEILVQVTKEPLGNKGPRLTSALSVPGRFLVLVPNDQNVGVSRKIVDVEERKRLRRLARSLKPEGFGLIIRTVASGKDLQTLRTDLDVLLKKWHQIEEQARKSQAPALIYRDLGITSSVVRDLFSPDIDRLCVDSKKLYGEIKKYLKGVAPGLISRLELHNKRTPVFDEFKIEAEITKSLSRKIWLKSGGHVIFDQTEAMMVVDVNTGRSVSERDQENNALRTDLEAAREIGRQLRLRDIGGIIVIDFIDLFQDKNRKKVVAELDKELKKDRAAFDILPMSDFGLVQLTRERERPSLLNQYSEQCPRCAGLGRIQAKTTIMTQIEREIQIVRSRTGARRMVLTVHPDVAKHLKEKLRKRMRAMMSKFHIILKIVPDEELKEVPFKLEPAGHVRKIKSEVSP